VRRIKSCLYNSPHPNLLPLEKEIILKSTALGGGGYKKTEISMLSEYLGSSVVLKRFNFFVLKVLIAY